VDDRRQGLRLDDQEEEELDDRYLEVAELGDHLDLNVAVAADEEPKVLELSLPQEFVEQHHFAAKELVQVQALEQQQVQPW
jgi:hypothetical protein